VGELLVELRARTQPHSLEAALRRALGDHALQLVRVRQEDDTYVDGNGELVTLPKPGDARVATKVVHQGAVVGALVHDRSLHLRPELLDAVNAAAGFALANERALATVQRVEARNRALLGAIPDLMLRVDADGTYVDVSGDGGFPVEPEQLVGRNIRDVAPSDVADALLACARRARESGEMHSVEYELELGGVVHYCESRMVPSVDGEVVIIMRDFTDRRVADAKLRRLAKEQAALRRVATFVAGDAAPEQVFQLVTEEVCRLLDIPSALLARFESATTARTVASYGGPPLPEVGSEVELEEGLAARRVLQTGAPATAEFDAIPNEAAARLRQQGFRSTVAVPIAVAGATWGTLIAVFRDDEVMPPHAERRLQAFAELVALALASAQARDELAASRRRIVEASDAERRRLERNLHDGAQQRLVALSVALRIAKGKIVSAPGEAEELLDIAAVELAEALVELRELAQGIHPAVLTERGLTSALEVLAARVPLPVALDVALPERLPEQVEAAVYYVVSEGLANVVKHAQADSARVRVARENGHVAVSVEDDGVGGATLDRGSGLCGLRDRVETLDGRLGVASSVGIGTALRAELPVRVHRALAKEAL
jgi:PAS domain S-box-containing protein